MYDKDRYPHMQTRGPWVIGRHTVRKDCLPIIDMGRSSRAIGGGDFEERSAPMLIVEDAKS